MEATTTKGEKVFLHPDGRWEYTLNQKDNTNEQKAFRNSGWGDSKSLVKKSETARLQRDEGNTLWYSSTVAGHPCTVLYVFAQDQLVRTKYIIEETHSNLNKFIDTFIELKNNLEKKYGPPKIDEPTWHNDLYLNDQQDWGFAISIGHLSVYAEWNVDNTSVDIAISGENNSIFLSIEYIGEELIHLEHTLNEQSILADL